MFKNVTLNTEVIFTNWYTPNDTYNLEISYNQVVMNNIVIKKENIFYLSYL
ncbi:MAG: hypothetical protein IIT97_02355 [Mycoplasmataceae bacterium]|nr:hypothetical protein [Mycoplasmataceae bacterium]